MKLHIIEDLYDNLDLSVIPENIEIIISKEIDPKMLDITNDMYNVIDQQMEPANLK